MKTIIGIDPGLNNTGWGIIQITNNNTLKYVTGGTILNKPTEHITARLGKIYSELHSIFVHLKPDECAIEDTFVNKNPMSSLKLGYAKGIALLASYNASIPIFEYAPRLIKKSVTGNGRAEKEQVIAMIKYLLPLATVSSEHESDALATAICHSNISSTNNRILMSSR